MHQQSIRRLLPGDRNMILAVLKESQPGERRVALVQESVKKLTLAGLKVYVETGAGDSAGYPDQAYADAGATVGSDTATMLRHADMLLKVGVPSQQEIEQLREGSKLLTSLMPTRNLATVRALAARKITAFSTDAIPRTTRAQAMDTLSSMAN